MFVCLVAQSCPTLCEPMSCSPAGSSIHGDSPGKNIGVGCHALLQVISPTQGWNPGLLRCRQILYHCATKEATYFCFMNKFICIIFLDSSYKLYNMLVVFSVTLDPLLLQIIQATLNLPVRISLIPPCRNPPVPIVAATCLLVCGFESSH